jgi:hypothetical protein
MTNEEYNRLEKRLQQLVSRVKEIEKLFPNFDNPTMDVIHKEYTKEAQAIQEQLTTKREYLYNFEGGGWNSEYAYTKELAIRQANERWQTTGMQADPTTFRVSTPSDYQNLLSLFY